MLTRYRTLLFCKRMGKAGLNLAAIFGHEEPNGARDYRFALDCNILATKNGKKKIFSDKKCSQHENLRRGKNINK